VRRGGDDFVDTERALCGAFDGVLKRQASDGRQLVSDKLRDSEVNSGTRSRGPTKRRTKRSVSFGNWLSSAGNHLSWLLST
jgi:hypothetical protein